MASTNISVVTPLEKLEKKADTKTDIPSSSLIMNRYELEGEYSQKNKIVVITVAPQGMGDIVAASRLISELQKKNPNLTFDWIIETIQNEIPSHFFPTGVTPRLIKELGTLDKDAFKAYNADLFVQFPDGGSFDVSVFGSIVGDLKKPFFVCTEYGGGSGKRKYDIYLAHKMFQRHEDITPEEVNKLFQFFESGFGKDCLGIFTDPFHDSKENSIKSLYSVDPKLFNMLFDSARGTKIDFFNETSLFFGYFSLETFNEDEDNLIEVEEYIIFCIKAGLANGKPNIDIIIPISQEQRSNIINRLPSRLTNEELKKLGKIDFLTKNIQSDFTNEGSSRFGEGDINVRVINAFPLKKEAMKHVLNMADPFVALTGDQSFGEGLCLLKIVLYQMMLWKTDSMLQLKDLCRELLGKDSFLYTFYLKQYPYNEYYYKTDEKQKRFWDYALTLYNNAAVKEQLFSDAKKLGQFLMNEHQLQKKLVYQIFKTLAQINTPSEPSPPVLLSKTLSKTPEDTATPETLPVLSEAPPVVSNASVVSTASIVSNATMARSETSTVLPLRFSTATPATSAASNAATTATTGVDIKSNHDNKADHGKVGQSDEDQDVVMEPVQANSGTQENWDKGDKKRAQDRQEDQEKQGNSPSSSSASSSSHPSSHSNSHSNSDSFSSRETSLFSQFYHSKSVHHANYDYDTKGNDVRKRNAAAIVSTQVFEDLQNEDKDKTKKRKIEIGKG